MARSIYFLIYISIAWLSITNQASAQACDTSFYDHNTSLMRISVCGQNITIEYEIPRPNMQAEKVTKGTLFFEGTISNRIIHGNARVYKKQCRPRTFYVNGIMQGNEIVLSGQAPSRDSNCKIKQFYDEVLHFYGR